MVVPVLLWLLVWWWCIWSWRARKGEVRRHAVLTVVVVLSYLQDVIGVGGLGDSVIVVAKGWWCLSEAVSWGRGWCSDEVLDG